MKRNSRRSTPICTTWRRTAARDKTMPLTKVEREKITDSVLKLQSVRASLENMDDSKIPDLKSVASCLKHADKNLTAPFRQYRPPIQTSRPTSPNKYNP